MLCDAWEEWAWVESRLFPVTLEWPVFMVRVTRTTGGERLQAGGRGRAVCRARGVMPGHGRLI